MFQRQADRVDSVVRRHRIDRPTRSRELQPKPQLPQTAPILAADCLAALARLPCSAFAKWRRVDDQTVGRDLRSEFSVDAMISASLTLPQLRWSPGSRKPPIISNASAFRHSRAANGA